MRAGINENATLWHLISAEFENLEQSQHICLFRTIKATFLKDPTQLIPMQHPPSWGLSFLFLIERAVDKKRA